MAESTWQPTGTLVVWDVDTLDRMQQEQLLAWMQSHASDLQVISLGERPVFPLVLREEFSDRLYYRLNMVCLTLANNLSVPLDAHSTMNVSRACSP
jgi:DNA-binding NtrC family response regulator